MAPIRKGNGTGLVPNGIAEVRKGDGTVLYSAGGAIPESAVARWTFDDADTNSGTAIDSWGSYDGTITGATTGVSGQYNEAYSFDGMDDFVDVTLSIDSLSNLSLSVWVKTSMTGRGGIMTWGEDGAYGEIPLVISDGSQGTSGGAVFRPGDGTESVSVTTPAINDGSWHHIVATLSENDEIEIYADGNLEDSTPYGTKNDPSSELNIGNYERTGDNFGGIIDDPRIYDIKLSGAEVSNLYSTGRISG